MYRSIYRSAALLSINRKFGDLWTSTIESKKVILKMRTAPLVDSVGSRLLASDEELIEIGGKIIEAASLEIGAPRNFLFED